jgi:hypothetical protein
VQKAEPEIVRDYQANQPRRNKRRIKSTLVIATACAAFSCLALVVWLKQGSRNPPVLLQNGTAAGSATPASPPIPAENGTDAGSPAPNHPPVSLENGTELMGFDGTGLGSLTIKNGTGLDAVAKLRTSADVNVYKVYIKAGHNWTIGKVPSGTYTLLFGLGVDWDAVSGRFLGRRTYSKFAETFAFTETPQIDGIVYSLFEVTLNPVPEGKARTLSIDEKEFEGNGYRSQKEL